MLRAVGVKREGFLIHKSFLLAIILGRHRLVDRFEAPQALRPEGNSRKEVVDVR
jgi:hypothetical protein